MRGVIARLAIVFAALSLAANPLFAQESDELQKLKDQMKAMQQMMQEMQAKIDAIEKSKAAGKPAAQPSPPQAPAQPPSPQPAPPPAGPQAQAQPATPSQGVPAAPATGLPPEPELSPALTSRQTVSDNPYGVARIDNAPLDPRMKGFFAIPQTETKLRIGGYTKLDVIHDFEPAGNTDWFVTSSIPIKPVADVSNTEIHVRQTRLNLELRRPFLGDEMRFYYENDFTGISQRAFNLRHAYGQWRNLLAGFTFSTLNDMDSLPDTLDFEGPGSAVFCYNPQIRYTWPITKKHSLAFAIEQPKSDVPTSMRPPNGGDITLTPNSPWPDFIIRYRYESDRGHIQVGTVYRCVGAWYKTQSDYDFCWGASVSGALLIGDLDQFQFQANYGQGLARYINDLGGMGYDLGITPDMHVSPLPLWGALASYQHYWNESLRSSLVYGYLKTDTYYEPFSTSFRSSAYAAANLIWNVKGSLTLGIEVLYGNHYIKDGSVGDATRIQFSFQYDFVK